MIEEPRDKLYWTETPNVYGVDDGDVDDDDDDYGLLRCNVTDTECAHRRCFLECNALLCVQYHCLPEGVQGQAVQLGQRRSTSSLQRRILEHSTDTTELVALHSLVWM